MKRPFLYLAVSLSAGILFAGISNIQFMASAFLCLIFLTLTLLSNKRRFASHISLYLSVFFLGMAYYQNAVNLPADHISNHIREEPKRVFVRGVIADDPVRTRTIYKKEKVTFALRAVAISDGWRKTQGLIMVNLYSENAPGLAYGDEIIAEGLLSRPEGLRNPGAFDYGGYLAIKDIYAILKVQEGFQIKKLTKASRAGLNLPYCNLTINRIIGLAYAVRHKINKLFDKYLDGDCSEFLKAILVGQRSALGKDIKEDFVKTGTVHVLAVSGLNVVLIAGIILFVLGMAGIPRKINLVLTMIFLAFYSLVSGANPPIVRSVIMFSIFACGYVIDRDADGLNSLSLAGCIILLQNPKELFDPSFQLSFASIAAMILFSPLLNGLCGLDNLKGNSLPTKIRRYILQGVSVSVAAWLGTWPIVAAYFNIVSPISLLANLIVIPVLFVLTAASFPFMLLAAMSETPAAIFAQGLRFVEEALFTINHWMADLPFAYSRVGRPGLAVTVLYYILILSLLLRRTKLKIRVTAVILILLNLFTWADVMRPGDKELRMTFLDVGQGDAVFIEFPGKGNMLVDGGSSGEDSGYDAGSSVIAPYLWSKNIMSIDTCIVTHFHEDHLGGIFYILENFKVGCVIDGGIAGDNRALYSEYVSIIRRRNIRRIIAGEGDLINSFQDAKLFVLNPQKDTVTGDPNDDSIVIKLSYRNFSALLCGDITAKSMASLLHYGRFLESDILKVPHHGGGLGEEEVVKNFFKTVSPRIAIVSAGKSDRFTNVSKITSEIISDLNIRCYETKNDGAISIVFNPKTSKITERSMK